jgi:hypothetical protein
MTIPSTRSVRSDVRWVTRRPIFFRQCGAELAVAVDGLCNQDGGIARLDENGGLSPVAFADYCDLVDKHIAGVRVVNRDGVWQREYYSYAFAPKPRFGPPTMANPNPGAGAGREPDATVLDEIYRHELVLRLPKVES